MFTVPKLGAGRGMSFLGGSNHTPIPFKKGGDRKVPAFSLPTFIPQTYESLPGDI